MIALFALLAFPVLSVPLPDPSVAENVGRFTQGVVEELGDTAKGAINVIRHPINTIKATGNSIAHPIDSIHMVKDRIVSAFKEDPAKAAGHLATSIGIMSIPVTNVISKSASVGANVIGKDASYMSRVGTGIKEASVMTVNALKSASPKAAGKASWNAVKSAPGQLRNAVKAAPSAVTDTFRALSPSTIGPNLKAAASSLKSSNALTTAGSIGAGVAIVNGMKKNYDSRQDNPGAFFD